MHIKRNVYLQNVLSVYKLVLYFVGVRVCVCVCKARPSLSQSRRSTLDPNRATSCSS